MQRYIASLLLFASMIVSDCYAIKIFSTDAKNSLIGRITGSFQRSLSNVVPDVNIQWDDENRTNTLNATEKSLNTAINTCAIQLRDLVNQLETATQGQLNHAEHNLHNIAQELNAILESTTDHAIERLEQMLPQINSALEHSMHTLDTKITHQVQSLYERFNEIITATDYRLQTTLYQAIDYSKSSLDGSIKSAAYAGSGTACTTIGAYMIANTLLYPPLDPPEGVSYTACQYGSAATLIAIGCSLIGYSDTLSRNGFTGCAHNMVARTIDTIRGITASHAES